LFNLSLDSFLSAWQAFHFLRPWWFLGLVPVVLIISFYSWHKHHAGNWATIINPELLPFLMQGQPQTKRLSTKALISALILAWIICLTSLAGPTWQQLPQSVHKQDSALIAVFDLSPSMLAEDLTPNRLVRGRYKLIDILKRRTEGVSGLVVYGGDAHTVSPLTEDSNTIISLVPVLHPTLLPQYGSNVEEAVETAVSLAISGGYQKADILLITDGVDPSAISDISSIIADRGEFRLSVLGVGTPDGAPIPLGSGGFVKDTRGNVIIPKLNINDLRRVAAANRGNYQTISSDNQDIDNLLDAMESLFGESTQQTDRSFDLWDDRGHWLALLLIPILLLSFRKGAVVVVLIAPLLFQSNAVEAFEWKDLWATRDQQGAKALELGDAESAKSLFGDPMWRGSAAYKAGDFDQASDNFSTDDTADGHYNQGNALAKSGDLDGALKAYKQALELQPAIKDAQFNHDLLEQLKDQQEQEQDQDQDQEQQSSDQEQDQQPSEQQQGEDSEQSDENSGASEEQPSEQESEQQGESEGSEEQAEEQSEEQSEEKPEGEKEQENNESKQQSGGDAEPAEMTDEEKQEQREIDAMLRRIPDDPGGLLRAKFRYESQMRKQQRPPPDQERW
jgi:Ca-activated chloride channel family protein